jgi:peptidoglycan/LPS O-acetylase OafA/YrhL
MSRKRYLLAVLGFAFWLLAAFPVVAWAGGNDVGQNVAKLLKGYASDLYGGIVAIIAVLCLLNRRYIELATFLFAAVVVAWMVFDPSDIAKAAEAIGKQIFGGE